MLFVIHCLDVPDQNRRVELYPAHRAYLDSHQDKVLAGGPLTDDDGETVVGSTLIVECDDRAAIDAWLAAEPFYAAGVYAEVRVLRWQQRRWRHAVDD